MDNRSLLIFSKDMTSDKIRLREEIMAKKEARRLAEEQAIMKSKDKAKLAIIAARRKADEEGRPFDEKEFAKQLILSKRAGASTAKPLQKFNKNDKNRQATEAAIQDQLRLSQIMAARRAEAESEPLENEDMAVAEGEELRRKREHEFQQNKDKSSSHRPAQYLPTAVTLPKGLTSSSDQEKLANIFALKQKQIEEHETEQLIVRKHEEEEQRLKSEKDKIQRQLALAIVADKEDKKKLNVKDQMRLATVAAKKRAEESNLPFDEVEFALNLIKMKRKLLDEERRGEILSLIHQTDMSGADKLLKDAVVQMAEMERTGVVAADIPQELVETQQQSEQQGAERDGSVTSDEAHLHSIQARVEDIIKAHEHVEATRLMLYKMNQRCVEQEILEEEQRLLELRKLDAERERQQKRTETSNQMSTVAEDAQQQVLATIRRLEEPPPAVNAKVAERAKLIAQAKAKAALEKKQRMDALGLSQPLFAPSAAISSVEESPETSQFIGQKENRSPERSPSCVSELPPSVKKESFKQESSLPAPTGPAALFSITKEDARKAALAKMMKEQAMRELAKEKSREQSKPASRLPNKFPDDLELEGNDGGSGGAVFLCLESSKNVLNAPQPQQSSGSNAQLQQMDVSQPLTSESSSQGDGTTSAEELGSGSGNSAGSNVDAPEGPAQKTEEQQMRDFLGADLDKQQQVDGEEEFEEWAQRKPKHKLGFWDSLFMCGDGSKCAPTETDFSTA